MPQDNLPPLRIRENDGSPNVIPVFHIILSSNLTLENKGGGIVSISATTGAGGTAQDPITFPLIIGSGGTGNAVAGSATSLVGMNSSASVYDYYTLVASDNTTITRLGTEYRISANTASGGSSVVYAATGNSYIVTDFATDLTGEFRLVQSGNSITINTASNLIIINAVTNAAALNIVYAATGNDYVLMNLAGDLTNEYRLVQSGNSITVTTATGLITINASTGDLSVKQNTITYPLGINSGGTGRVSATTANALVGINSDGLVYDYFYLKASDNLTILRSGTGIFISAITNAAGIVYARTGNTYLVVTLTDDLTSERALTASTGIVFTDNGAGANFLASLSSPLVARAQNDASPYIQAWQNTAGTILSSIDSSGYGFLQTITFALALGGSNSGVGTNQTNVVLAPRNGKIISCDARAKTAPVGAALIFDINLNGSTIWATQGNRITIADGSTGGTQSTFDSLAFVRTDTFTIDIDQIGSTTPGKDITVQLLMALRNQ